ncbi:hypothetical protein HUA76_11815 [Myxococcus sp. CA056]|uniref:DUF7151 family protein n=1 Tax=unclassified Myxococcus TaxID=2648731 RepID=UPI00157A9379|nr:MULTISPECIES: hypothetical protein [unclassified Myxococcus]NTX11476.1 hypothetical protein [Myxococcus sp. CA056]NTX34425.1 hypothetical protein [Myxococcus sp. CA033]
MMRPVWMTLLVLTVGCDGIDLEQLVRQHNPLSRFEPEAPGENCEHGGRRTLTGLDLDDDGVLDDAEVSSTSYDCALAPPRVLVVTQTLPPGTPCPLGGQRFRAGLDVNGDGQLEDAEVTQEVVTCRDASTVVYRVSDLNSYPLACDEGTSLLEAGPDLDGDGALGDTERRAQTIVCAPASMVRVRPQPEPPGARCASGGTRLNVGTDTNGNGTLEDSEVATRTYVCLSENTFTGDYYLRDAVDLEVLRSLSRIQGSLNIQDTALAELVLPSLSAVEGPLYVGGNTALTRLEMDGLRFVGGDVAVYSNPELETLTLGGSTEQGILWVERDLSVQQNPRLASLDGLKNVRPRGSLSLFDNDSLTLPASWNLTELPGSLDVIGNAKLTRLPFRVLKQVGGSIAINENPALTALELTQLETVGNTLTLRQNGSLTDLSGLPVLRTIQEGLYVTDNDALVSTSGLGELHSVSWLSLADNDALTACDFPRLAAIHGRFDLTRNKALTHLGTFPALSSLPRLALSENDVLNDVSGLGNLRSMEELEVTGNPALKHLDGLSHLKSLTKLKVDSNPALERLGLGGLQEVRQTLGIVWNTALPTCLANTLADRVFIGTERDIRGNDDTATCATPVLPVGDTAAQGAWAPQGSTR